MHFEVLKAQGADAGRWSGLIARLEAAQRDIHFLPQYARIYERTYGHEPFLAFFGDSEHYVVQAFIKRALNGLPFLEERGTNERYFDIASQYGYGGPAWRAQGLDEAVSLYRGMRHELAAWCIEQRIATEFVNLHPLLENECVVAAAGIAISPEKQVVYIDCAAGETTLWAGMNRGHKSNLQRARKSGIRVTKVEPSAHNVAEFARLYYLTMDRNRAAERWYFPERYFTECVAQLGVDRVSLFFATTADALASAYLLMHDFGVAYYHFAGSDPRFFELRANNAIMYETALWATRAGFRKYHLGGGVGASEEDSLFRFKAGFSPLRATLFSYGIVHHEAMYRELCELKTRHEIATAGAASGSGFFPTYRR